MQNIRLPFEHLNLRWNPFGEVPAEERGGLAVLDIERFVPRLAKPGFAVEFVGDCGRGKSTRLRYLWDHFEDAPFLRVEELPPSGFWARLWLGQQRSGGKLPAKWPSAEELIARHGENIRSIERHLYEVFQRLSGVCDVEVRYLD